MSMSYLAALQSIEAFLAYVSVVVLLPALVFKKRFERLNFMQRFMAYFTIGNFYIMNLVFALELLKISNRFTLTLGTLLPAAFAYARTHGFSLKQRVKGWGEDFQRLLTGMLGGRTVLYRIFSSFGRGLKNVGRIFVDVFLKHILDWAVLLGITALFLQLYGTNVVTNFGYMASDIPVHNYWINGLSDNHIFVAGIYPFGFHCEIYYLHMVFGIDTYVLLRVFCVVQTFFVMLMVLLLLKYCCKTKFIPYIGLLVYMAINVYSRNTYSRYVATLPQEFGMLFIYPSAYFAFAFFKERKLELKQEKELFGNRREQKALKKQEKFERKLARIGKEKRKKKYYKLHVKDCFSTWYLAGFAMSFSMTLSVHFYGTMIAGLFCVGIAAGYFFRLLRPKYFWRVACTFFISIFVAVLPMGIAFAMGTPLQGSLGWGMNVLKGTSGKTEKVDAKEETLRQYENYLASGGAAGGTASGSAITSGASVTVGENDGAVSGGSIAVSGAGVTVGENGGMVSGDSAIVSGAAIQGDGPGNGMEETVSREVMEAQVRVARFKLNQYLPKTLTVQGGILVTQPGLHKMYNVPYMKYKRPISSYVKLLLKNPKQFLERIKIYGEKLWFHLQSMTQEYVLNGLSAEQITLMYLAVIALLALSLFLFLFLQPDYGAAILSTIGFAGCMCLLLISGRIGLPTLMDPSRCSIYFAYMTPLLLAFLIDILLYYVAGWLKWKWVKWIPQLISLLCFMAAAAFMVQENLIREPRYTEGLEMNEAIMCLTNIIRDEKDYTWTICSANDETRMGEDHGWHYEIITFLKGMEGMAEHGMITIPTQTVYFFIEKVPLDYMKPYADSGQRISEEGAERNLPGGTGLSVYQGENRWIVMSRMYYWAQEFQRLYPNEMKVYLETDKFVCYKIEQNTYRLYNFAIDYGYNTYDLMDEMDEMAELVE